MDSARTSSLELCPLAPALQRWHPPRASAAFPAIIAWSLGCRHLLLGHRSRRLCCRSVRWAGRAASRRGCMGCAICRLAPHEAQVWGPLPKSLHIVLLPRLPVASGATAPSGSIAWPNYVLYNAKTAFQACAHGSRTLASIMPAELSGWPGKLESTPTTSTTADALVAPRRHHPREAVRAALTNMVLP